MAESLYEMSTDLAEINDQIIDANGEITPQLEVKLDALKIALADKTHKITRWVRNLESNEAMITEEVARLQRRREISTNLRNRLKAYVKFCMEKADIKKYDFPLFTARIQANPPSVEIVNQEDIPSRFWRVTYNKEIMKNDILKALKDGEEITGAKLVTDRTHLRIK